MKIFQWFGSIIGIIYGSLTLFACLVQYYEKKISMVINVLMGIGASILLLSVVGLILEYEFKLLILITGLILIHISAILNGYKLYHKINLSHHIVRLVISTILIVLFLFA